MIRVWTDSSSAGVLDRSGLCGSTFVYGPDAPLSRAVSVTMPVRLASWGTPLGVAPIFEMKEFIFNPSTRSSQVEVAVSSIAT